MFRNPGIRSGREDSELVKLVELGKLGKLNIISYSRSLASISGFKVK